MLRLDRQRMQVLRLRRDVGTFHPSRPATTAQLWVGSWGPTTTLEYNAWIPRGAEGTSAWWWMRWPCDSWRIGRAAWEPWAAARLGAGSLQRCCEGVLGCVERVDSLSARQRRPQAAESIPDRDKARDEIWW